MKLLKKCKVCGKESKYKYCTPECKKTDYSLVCERCKKTFYHKNMSYVRLGRLKFCSNVCKNKKYLLNEDYFSDEHLNDDKLITFGQMLSRGYIIDWRTIKLYGGFNTLTLISEKLSCTFKIQKLGTDRYQLLIRSEKMVNDMIRLGLPFYNPMYAEFPPLKKEMILCGLFDTEYFTHVPDENMKIFQTTAYKLALEISDMVGGKIVSKLYKEAFGTNIVCEWVIIF